MSFKLSKTSLERLATVHPDLQKVVHRAIEIATEDFFVVEGARTLEQQKIYVRQGKSQTMNSNHIPKEDGYSHAVDLAPYPLTWNINAFFSITRAMRQAAEELNITIRWGGAWCKLNGDKRAPSRMIDEYTAMRRKTGNRVFIDAPHFELINN